MAGVLRPAPTSPMPDITGGGGHRTSVTDVTDSELPGQVFANASEQAYAASQKRAAEVQPFEPGPASAPAPAPAPTPVAPAAPAPTPAPPAAPAPTPAVTPTTSMSALTQAIDPGKGWDQQGFTGVAGTLGQRRLPQSMTALQGALLY